MKKRIQNLMRKKWFFPFAVVFLLGVCALGTQLTYSAYIHRSYVKAVIATNETEKLFGSNLLYGVKNQPDHPESDDWLSVYPYTVADPTQDITIPLKIYNYLAEDKDRVNQLDVSYRISFQIQGNTSDTLSGYYLNVNNASQDYPFEARDTVYYLGSSGLTTSIEDAATQTIPGRIPQWNEYKIKMPKEALNKVSVVVKAERVPNASGNYGTDLLYLAAKVVPSLASTVIEANVSGRFPDRDDTVAFAEYAAYNYEITLTGAPTAVVLRRNPQYVEIVPFFEAKFGVTPENGQVTFNMEPGMTRIQFYRTSESAGNWDALGIRVTER